MELKEASRILVLDPIHGADVIVDELNELGKEAEVFNPYRESTFTHSLDFDLVITPVHLNPTFEVVKQAVPIIIQTTLTITNQNLESSYNRAALHT